MLGGSFLIVVRQGTALITETIGPDEAPDPLCCYSAPGPNYDKLLSLNLPFFIGHRTVYFLSEHCKPPASSSISLTKKVKELQQVVCVTVLLWCESLKNQGHVASYFGGLGPCPQSLMNGYWLTGELQILGHSICLGGFGGRLRDESHPTSCLGDTNCLARPNPCFLFAWTYRLFFILSPSASDELKRLQWACGPTWKNTESSK